jgi:predicted HTH domain antitoxin
MNETKPMKEILPATGIWSIEDMAKYLGMAPDDLQQKLTDKGIKVLHLGTRYKARLIRLEDLKAAGNPIP